MLLEVQALKPEFYADFESHDLEMLTQYLSVLRVSKGDQVIQKGEPATFLGIVLEGCLEVSVLQCTSSLFAAQQTRTSRVVSSFAAAVQVDLYSLKVQLPKGTLVGEMNYFGGGDRSASVVAATDSIIAGEELLHRSISTPVCLHSSDHERYPQSFHMTKWIN